jgi:hypothetical protein
MDSRVMPAQIFGLEIGDAEYIRNGGGRVTDDVIRQAYKRECIISFVEQYTKRRPSPFTLMALHCHNLLCP